MAKRGLGREQIHEVAWNESYPHPMVSCMMPGIALLAMAALCIFGFQFWQWSLPRDTTVPRTLGFRQAEAIAILQRAGLDPEIDKGRQTNEDIPEGAVVTTEPAAGRRVKSGRTVHVVLSSGSAYTRVPEVRELSQSEARERLNDADIHIASEEYIYHDSIGFDRVIDIAPKAGTRIKRFSTVKLKVSKGTAPTDVDPILTEDVNSTVVTANLPNDFKEAQEARIDVTDENGKRTVYQEVRQPGETLIETVQGSGNMTIQVYYGTRLILTRKL